jgi:glycosyltransferase involved in cell wall biosynthesis
VVEISLVVSTFQRREILSRSLPSVLGQDLETGRFEAIVVVDGSTDGTVEMLSRERDPALRVLTQENRGLAAARNRGAREARGRVVLFLDDDAHASPGLARAHLDRHAGGLERVVLGPFPLLPSARRSFLADGVGRWADDLAARLSSPGYKPRFTDCCFANASLPRALWERTGGFNETFRRFGNEDYDYGLRLLAAGTDLTFEPRAIAWQDYRKSYATWCREWRDIGRADLELSRLHPEVAPEMAFSRLASLHPARRACCSLGLQGSLAAGLAIAPIRIAVSLADKLGMRGALLDRVKWLPADYQYGLGVREGSSHTPDSAIA